MPCSLWLAFSHYQLAKLNPVTKPVPLFLRGTLFCLSPLVPNSLRVFPDHSGSARSTLSEWTSAVCLPYLSKTARNEKQTKSSLRKTGTPVHSCLLFLRRKKWPLRGIASLVCLGARRLDAFMLESTWFQYLFLTVSEGVLWSWNDGRTMFKMAYLEWPYLHFEIIQI